MSVDSVAQGISIQGGEINVFLSYARADEDVYGMVRPFKQLLGHFIHAKSGLHVRAFLDQDNLRWGELWEDALDREILKASVFIPLLSPNYLASENCRKEFLLFQNSAKNLGVNELLLPVLLLDAPAIFNSSSEDQIVQGASSRQWEIIESAILSDASSSEWKRGMAHLAGRFVDAYNHSASILANQSDNTQLGTIGNPESDPEDLGADEETDDGPGLAETTESINQNVARFTASAKNLLPAMSQLGSIATESTSNIDNMRSTKDFLAWTHRTAEKFQAPSQLIKSYGEEMFDAVQALDVDVKRLRQQAEALAPHSPNVVDSYNQLIRPLVEMDDVSGPLFYLLDQMNPAEQVSAALRRALKPARIGITRIADADQIVRSWRPLDLV